MSRRLEQAPYSPPSARRKGRLAEDSAGVGKATGSSAGARGGVGKVVGGGAGRQGFTRQAIAPRASASTQTRVQARTSANIRYKSTTAGDHLVAKRMRARLDASAEEREKALDFFHDRLIPWFFRWLRRCTALFVLLPLASLMTASALVEIARSGSTASLWLSIPVWYTLMGAAIWLIFYFSGLCRPLFLYLYVFGHELTHAIAILLCGGRIAQFEVTLDGGYVISNKNNVFIALAPYFVPIWVLAWLILCGISTFFVDWQQFSGLLFAGLGFWWGFHFIWTLWIIPKDQPDLKENGTFFSLMIIYLINLCIILGVLFPVGILKPMAFAREFIVQSDGFLTVVNQGLSALMRFLAP